MLLLISSLRVIVQHINGLCVLTSALRSPDVRVLAAHLHLLPPAAGRRNPALLHHPQVQGALLQLQPIRRPAGEPQTAPHLRMGN